MQNPASSRSPDDEGTMKTRYRMGNETSATFTLPDGRKLGYALYGASSNRAVFYLHGLPGSRIEAAVFDEHGTDLGVRIIGVDRPSVGWSSPHPERKILDHAQDIEHLAKHLELKDYGVLVRANAAMEERLRRLADFECALGDIWGWTVCPRLCKVNACR